MNFKVLTAALIACVGFGDSSAWASERTVQLWRLDCGEMAIDDIAYFSDSYHYRGQFAEISNGCYLVRNGDRYLLWEAGLPVEVLNNKTKEDGWLERISSTLESQLATIGVTPKAIEFLAVSHYHGDHIGQADRFSDSTLLMNKADVTRIRNVAPGNARKRLSAWFDHQAKLIEFDRDHDVFGDGKVMILATPGHTPGHSSLLVFLARRGPVLLTGDLFHFRSEVGKRNVSRWNTSRADTLASIERFEAIVHELNPTVIVQHDQGDVKRLPQFPEFAD
jgi:N-acyl homoserine lactone hydrolase